jgi:hypothetical protein
VSMTNDNYIKYLQYQLRAITKQRDILQTRVDGMEARAKVEGLTEREERRLWRLCQARNFDKLEQFLMRILSPNVWMTKAELRELLHLP